ncbi:hypothetical protein DICPUDRAFT_58624 [Dictyostelium purpureum]|uniref:Dipeptidyl peptidase 3 n=1 Tax=Dictyostelium purpureum TaxID=5786 RepID=F1A200_DICPU|nr:uncharacterized protein DICPUDRAFT_58624 [Dictyostelium purpureum]EGC29783.1 hypothetical protein DICPUDRAFT_58624 [Dictyostelium purpureum]|eukprot:XP_003293691.1 hypothetical protein DICPUDRAFT_58624 [Dictyostelium purpureum]
MSDITPEIIESHTVSRETPVYKLDATEAFKKLTEKEKLYSHYLSQACWWGSKICLGQTSVESAPIFHLLQNIFSLSTFKALREKLVPSVVSEVEYNDLLLYAATFYGNMGNYLSFGDSKFIPRIPKEKFEKIIKTINNETISKYWSQCGELMYSLEKNQRELGVDGNGISTYYSPNITKVEIEKVQKFLDSIHLSPYNTRLFKVSENNYNVLVASVNTIPVKSHQYEGYTINIVYGDWSKDLARVADNMRKAIPYAANDNQVNMLKKYVEHFEDGSIEVFKDSQRWWIKDLQPTVETNIGFIETYRDPAGVRGEFEGFVAMVNKEMSQKLTTLIDKAEYFLAKYPWPKEFEKAKFNRPDFTSLEVLTFASSGVPAGINIPNDMGIRQNEGFKNVSLGNVISARKDEYVTFIPDEDQKMYNKLQNDAFEVQVAIHELLGHGSGRIFHKNADGTYDFDTSIINPITGKPIDLDHEVYKTGETYDSVFKSLGSSWEECRAECCGMYLSPDLSLLELFGFKGQEAEDVYYINWLIMARAGICALEFYTPELKKWRQAHMQGRFAILQVFLRSGLVKLEVTDDNVLVRLDRAQIRSKGLPGVGEFLKILNIYKATANVKAATALFDDYTSVDAQFIKIRDIVLAKKKPRRVFVQSHTHLNVNNQVYIQDFADNAEGVIESMITRFGTEE